MSYGERVLILATIGPVIVAIILLVRLFGCVF